MGLEYVGTDIVERLKRMLGWRRGELKCRSVKKAARRRGVELGEILATIRGSVLAYSVARRHLSVTGRLIRSRSGFLRRLCSRFESVF